MAAHAKLGASGSAKWLACSAALAMEEAAGKPDTGSFAANEGTAAHELAYRSLSTNTPPGNFLGEIILVNEGKVDQAEFEVTHEMVEAVEVLINYVKNLQGCTHFYEQKVDYSHIAPEGFGTADVVVETTEKVNGKGVNKIYVIDLKYGKGIKVDAFENTQGLCYASGTLNSLDMLLERDPEVVVIVIVQPRIGHIGKYEISVKDLYKWEREKATGPAMKSWGLLQKVIEKKDKGITGAALTTHIVPDMFNPTEKGCQWCRVRKTCKPKLQEGYALAVDGFADMSKDEQADIASIQITKGALVDPYTLSTTELAVVYKGIGVFRTWLNKLSECIEKTIRDGEEVPGLKLVATEGKRAWKDDEAATVKALRTAGLQKKDYESINIISPTQAEKVLKKVKPIDYTARYVKLANKAVHNPAGKDRIVADSDGRPAIAFNQTDGADDDDLDFMN